MYELCLNCCMVKATIRAGSSKPNICDQLYTSAQIIQHPSYNSKKFENDVAVIRTTRPIILYGINTKVVKLIEEECDVEFGTNIKVSGWGATKEGDQTVPYLMSVVVKAVSSDVCSQQLPQNITPCQVCAGLFESGKGVCQGDSGGLAVILSSPRSEYTCTTCSAQIGDQVGILSFGYGCARPGQDNPLLIPEYPVLLFVHGSNVLLESNDN